MPRKTRISPEDLYQIRQPLQCRLSPDRTRLLTVVSQAHREQLKNLSHLWMVSLDGEPASKRRAHPAGPPGDPGARQFTHGRSSEVSPRWSPDGGRIAFISARSGKSELWIMPADGGEARQLTRLQGSVNDLAWHPSGRSLAISFTPVDEEAKEREKLKKQGKPGHDAPRVRAISRLFYKLDGTGFIPQGRSHLWLVDASTGRTRQLTKDDRFDEQEPVFSPCGRWLYFVSNRTDDPDLNFQRVDVWRLPSRGGRVEKVPSFDGPSTTISLSPDGRWMAYLGTQDPKAPWNQYHTKIWLVPAGGGRPVQLAPNLDRSCYNSTISDTFGVGGGRPAIWSPDSQWVYFAVTSEGNTEIWRSHVRERRAEPVLQEPGAVIDFEIDFEGGWLHTTWSGLSNPGEVRSFPLPPAPASPGRRRSPRVEESRQIRTPLTRTRFNSEWLESRLVAVPEEVRLDGQGRSRLQGWVLSPRPLNRRRRHPAMLYIHGGPATQYGRVYFHEFQVLAANGYVVMYCNPRGGTGYSEKHLNAIVGRWGTRDYDDLMRFTDHVLRRFRHVDRRRVAVGGGSYGGYMTNWIIGHTNRFACAVTSRSISNLMSFVGSSDFGYAWPQEFRTTGPWENPSAYLRMSPLTYLRKMRTPTLIEHQEEDHRCPMEQAEQLWAALKAKGIPVEFVRYPGEPHGMSRGGRPDRRIDRMERILSWLGRWTTRPGTRRR